MHVEGSKQPRASLSPSRVLLRKVPDKYPLNRSLQNAPSGALRSRARRKSAPFPPWAGGRQKCAAMRCGVLPQPQTHAFVAGMSSASLHTVRQPGAKVGRGVARMLCSPPSARQLNLAAVSSQPRGIRRRQASRRTKTTRPMTSRARGGRARAHPMTSRAQGGAHCTERPAGGLNTDWPQQSHTRSVNGRLRAESPNASPHASTCQRRNEEGREAL